jgi:plastocyanin
MRSGRRIFLFLGGGLMTALAAGCSAEPSARPSDPAGPARVVIDNFTFDPPELTVPVGATVTWVNRDDVPHTATSTARPRAFDSGALDTDDTFSSASPPPARSTTSAPLTRG